MEAEIWAAIERLQADGVSAEALADIRSRYRYGFLSDLTTPDEVAPNLARFAAITGDIQVVDDLFATLDEVTPEDVVEAARHYLRLERSTVATLHAADQPIPEAAPANEPVLMPIAQDPNVTFKLWFQVGSQNDPPGKEGLAALTAAMISDGGTGQLSYEEILEALYPMAASYWVSVDKEMTVVRGQAHREVASRFYDLFSSAILDPGFRQEDFDRLQSRCDQRHREAAALLLGRGARQGGALRRGLRRHALRTSRGRSGVCPRGDHPRRREGLLPSSTSRATA